MENFTENLNLLVSLGTILGQIFVLAVLLLWLRVRFGKKSGGKGAEKVLEKIGSYGIWTGFLVAITSTVVSLVYSNVVGFAPCELCWIQRIFLYPQTLILGLALWKKTRDADLYCLALSVIGGLIALYHFYGQSFNPNALPACDATGAASCAVRFFVEFGYITIPLMSLTAFASIAVSMLSFRFTQK